LGSRTVARLYGWGSAHTTCLGCWLNGFKRGVPGGGSARPGSRAACHPRLTDARGQNPAIQDGPKQMARAWRCGSRLGDRAVVGAYFNDSARRNGCRAGEGASQERPWIPHPGRRTHGAGPRSLNGIRFPYGKDSMTGVVWRSAPATMGSGGSARPGVANGLLKKARSFVAKPRQPGVGPLRRPPRRLRDFAILARESQGRKIDPANRDQAGVPGRGVARGRFDLLWPRTNGTPSPGRTEPSVRPWRHPSAPATVLSPGPFR